MFQAEGTASAKALRWNMGGRFKDRKEASEAELSEWGHSRGGDRDQNLVRTVAAFTVTPRSRSRETPEGLMQSSKEW